MSIGVATITSPFLAFASFHYKLTHLFPSVFQLHDGLHNEAAYRAVLRRMQPSRFHAPAGSLGRLARRIAWLALLTACGSKPPADLVALPPAPIPTYGLGDSYQFTDGSGDAVISVGGDLIRWQAKNGTYVTARDVLLPRLAWDTSGETGERRFAVGPLQLFPLERGKGVKFHAARIVRHVGRDQPVTVEEDWRCEVAGTASVATQAGDFHDMARRLRDARDAGRDRQRCAPAQLLLRTGHRILRPHGGTDRRRTDARGGPVQLYVVRSDPERQRSAPAFDREFSGRWKPSSAAARRLGATPRQEPMARSWCSIRGFPIDMAGAATLPSASVGPDAATPCTGWAAATRKKSGRSSCSHPAARGASEHGLTPGWHGFGLRLCALPASLPFRSSRAAFRGSRLPSGAIQRRCLRLAAPHRRVAEPSPGTLG